MPKINVKVDPRIIAPVYRPYLDCQAFTQIYFGGSSSGKSYFLAQRCIMDILKGGRNYLIVRKAQTAVKKSVFNEICKAINTFKVSKLFDINKSDMTITCHNGYQIMFSGLDDVEKIQGVRLQKGIITDVWIEEATDCDYEDVKQLKKRLRGRSRATKRLTMSFNPIFQQHWIFLEYFAPLGWTEQDTEYHDEHLFILKTTYKDNPYLTEETIYDLEHESDPYWYNVYSLGNFGVLGHVIYNNWVKADLSDRSFESYSNGLDFGFGVNKEHPAALVQCHYSPAENTIYVTKAEYRFNMTNDLLAAECENFFGSSALVIADCARPDNIADLRRRGINIVACKKGPDSVLNGIQWIQKCRLVVDERCTDLIAELSTYHWKEDKNGVSLPEPVKRQDDLLDALRYSLMYEMFVPEPVSLKRPIHMPAWGAM